MVESKKDHPFDKVNPEDVHFGISLGEGNQIIKLISLQALLEMSGTDGLRGIQSRSMR